jgi:hypothetical protein
MWVRGTQPVHKSSLKRPSIYDYKQWRRYMLKFAEKEVKLKSHGWLIKKDWRMKLDKGVVQTRTDPRKQTRGLKLGSGYWWWFNGQATKTSTWSDLERLRQSLLWAPKWTRHSKLEQAQHVEMKLWEPNCNISNQED